MLTFDGKITVKVVIAQLHFVILIKNIGL